MALSTLDIVVFFASLAVVMFLGLWFGGRDHTSQDYFLAGKKTRWWGVAGSIFGSNVSANHIVGMLGVGYSIGFAQSHFEIGAIVGLLLLCYGFLPVYKKMGVYTLSDYLAQRFDNRARLLYAMTMLFIIVFVMMVPGFYIGSRSLNILLTGNFEYVEQSHYIIGIVVMAIVTGSYTIFGGLKAVIVTDVFQSILLLLATLIVAWITFSQPEINGWQNMLEIDAENRNLMHLYLPSDHPDLPWTGVLSGLFIMHFYYWGANQFIVQRALSAQSMKEARFGIIIAGLLKLLIPFLSVGTGIAAYYLFQKKGFVVDQDAAFTTLITEFIQPLGFGILGFVAAGLIGAILSSLDSMMNSASTIITFDIYKTYLKPDADDEKLIQIGKVWISLLITLAACLAIFLMDPNSKDSFFLTIAKHQANLISGIAVVFALGMFWPRANANGAFTAMIVAVICSYSLPWLYSHYLRDTFQLKNALGLELNFLHTIVISSLCAMAVHILFSICSHEKASSNLTWVGLEVHKESDLKYTIKITLLSVIIMAVIATLMVFNLISNFLAACTASIWVCSIFIKYAIQDERGAGRKLKGLFMNDKFYAGLLAGTGTFIMYFYY